MGQVLADGQRNLQVPFWAASQPLVRDSSCRGHRRRTAVQLHSAAQSLEAATAQDAPAPQRCQTLPAFSWAWVPGSRGWARRFPGRSAPPPALCTVRAACPPPATTPHPLCP